MRKVIKLFRYIQREENYAANSLIYSLKKDNRRDVLNLASDMLSDAIKRAEKTSEDFLITNVPRRRSAIIKRGFDHAALLAKSTAKKLSIEYKNLFVSKSKRAQKKLTAAERKINAVFEPKFQGSLKGKTVIIVDDVITSGSSIGACASIAYSLGAKRVIAAAIGIAYKDSQDYIDYTYF